MPHRYLQRARIFPARAASCNMCCGSSRRSEHRRSVTCHCGRVRITLAREPDDVTHCNCSLCTKSGFQGIYYSSGRGRDRGRARQLCAGRFQPRPHRPAALPPLRDRHALDAANRSSARAPGHQRPPVRAGNVRRYTGEACRRAQPAGMSAVHFAVEVAGWAGRAADPAGLSAAFGGQADRASRRSISG